MTFTPRDSMVYRSALVIATNDPDRPNVEVAIAGTGYQISGDVAISLTSITGDQRGSQLEVTAGDTIVAELYATEFPEVIGYGFTISFDPRDLSFLNNSFEVGPFLPESNPLTTSRSGAVEIGIASLTGKRTQGHGLIGKLRFRVREGFGEGARTTIGIPIIAYSLSAGAIEEKTINAHATLIGVNPYIPGDFDRDGNVGFRDFLLFSQAFGGTNSLYDLDGNGSIGFGDFLVFAANFGKAL